LDSLSYLLIEALHKRRRILYDNLSDPKFLKEIKRGMEMSAADRESYMDSIEQKIVDDTKKGLTPDRLQISLREFRSYFLDDDLWRFLNKFGGTIFEKVSSEGEEPTEQEASIAKEVESYKKARESSNIPIPQSEEKTDLPPNEVKYMLTYYKELGKLTGVNLNELDRLTALFSPLRDQKVREEGKMPFSEDMNIDIERTVRDVEGLLVLYTKKREPKGIIYADIDKRSIKDICYNILDSVLYVKSSSDQRSGRNLKEVLTRLVEDYSN
jgi:hypothetical protein